MDETKRYWFKRKRYGWGWTPVTWQGWAVLIAAIAAPVLVAFTFPADPEQPTLFQKILFGCSIVYSIASIVLANYFRGPSPKWRWGKTSYDDPEEDF